MYTEGIRVTHAACAIILLTYSSSCTANPLIVRPASSLAMDEISEPTCTDLEKANTSNASLPPHTIGTFPTDCVETANEFFNFPMIAEVAWHWKRAHGDRPPPPGYNFLPYSTAPTTCMITLDVLDDPDAEDQFALVQIADDFRALFTKCIRASVYGPSSGFIPVGPRKVLKLSVGPTPEGGMHNFTAGGYDFKVGRASAKRDFVDLVQP